MIGTESRGQSTTALVVVGIALVLGAIAVGFAVFGGFVSSPASESGQSTPVVTADSTSIPTKMMPKRTTIPTQPSTPTVSPTPTPTSTPTPTVVPTQTQRPTDTAVPDPYKAFKNAMLYALAKRANVPVRFRGMRVVDKDLYFVVNYTARSEDPSYYKRERAVILVAYAWAVYWHDNDEIVGNIPTGMQILEINNTDITPKTAYVSTDNIRDWNNGTLSDAEFGRLVSLSTRNQTAEERALVRSIDRAWENRTYHNKSYDPYG